MIEAVQRRPYCLLLAIALLLALIACRDDGDARAGDGKLVVTGSSTIAPLVADVAARYEAEHPGVRVDVQTGGSSRGMADARQGLADVGMVSRSPKGGEDDLAWHAIARDGLALIVHASNPVASLDREDVLRIYRGEVGRWSEIDPGLPDAEITVVHKAQGRSTLEVFLDHFGLQDREVQPDVVIGDNQQGIKTVAGNPHALAYVSIGTAEYEAGAGTPIRLVGLGDAEPTTESVADGSYPVARTLHLVTLPGGGAEKGRESDLALDFVAYARSRAVHDLVREHFFVPLDPGAE